MARIDAVVQRVLLQSARERLTKLQALNAPEVLIAAQQAKVNGDGGLSKVGHLAEFGKLEVSGEPQPREYRRGWGLEFTVTDGSRVWLIPGPYGLFLTDRQGNQ
ncbi:MAG: hypothetical protein IPO08_23665 [Xanthomonadales bacterium]|nr:hypothetical protein [Xanthomonadales bacterium]